MRFPSLTHHSYLTFTSQHNFCRADLCCSYSRPPKPYRDKTKILRVRDQTTQNTKSVGFDLIKS